MAEAVWTLRLAATAEADYRQIVRWTAENFGPLQARTYADTLSSALQALGAGPATVGAQERTDIGPHLWTLHVARHKRKGRHFVLFRIDASEPQNVVDVLRLLHDSMDLERHLPPSERH
jgi:toxin ParE1/3/4